MKHPDTITLQGLQFCKKIDATEIAVRIAELGDALRGSITESPLELLCVLKGAVPFAHALSQCLPADTRMHYVRAQSYHEMKSSGSVRISGFEGTDLRDKNILIVEDIVESGHTIAELKKMLNTKYTPLSVRVATLLFKPECLKYEEAEPEYCGFRVPEEFVVGYGLDYKEEGRGLPHIYSLLG